MVFYGGLHYLKISSIINNYKLKKVSFIGIIYLYLFMAKKTIHLFFIGIFVLIFSLGAFFSYSLALSQDPKQFSRKIIVFEDGDLDDMGKDELVKKHGGVKIKDLKIIHGKAVLISKEDEDKLSREHGVKRIDEDVVVRVLEREDGRDNEGNTERLDKKARTNAPSQPIQTLPWGIDRIDADLLWSVTTADLIKVGIIDTGIELSHLDLAANIKGGYNAINPTKSANDDNGHGTHVAGTVAALNNSIGVVGAGHKIDLYAVKVLNRNGSGFLSDVIEGIDWAVQNRMNVINMSLGTISNIQSLHDAVVRAHSAGVVVVAAAGNENGGPVNFPGAYPEAIAVSATDINNNIASFSSVGPEVDLAAPGVNILSTYRGGRYATVSGTSMASPHVAGAAALLLSIPSKCDFDLNGVCSPSEVRERLEQTAIDLGASGKDNIYGSGLVNAFQAIMR